jgi:nucleoside-diphosphate-sugar epimerase
MDNMPDTIFLTGFPGFIAGRLVERSARAAAAFYLLVEPRFVEKALRDCEEISARTGAKLEKFAIVEGDITKPDLGIAPEDLEVIRAETTHVYHLAAAYDLAVSKDAAYAVNLGGTRNVNELARSLPNLQKYNYISTCYVAGKREGRIMETELEHDAGFRNYYEETKYLAEIEVERLKDELPVTIFRPSVVVGDSRTGEIPKYDGIYYLIRYLRRAPGLLRLINIGNAEVTLNLVPVDFVAGAIDALGNDAAAIGKTIALADPAPLTTRELFDSIAESMTGRGSLIAPPRALIKWALSRSFSPPLTGLPLSGVPYFFISQNYDTAVAAELLSRHGITCPGFRDYVDNLVDFVEKNPGL